MNLAFKRELELAEFDALSGDAEKFFDREERLIAMDIHGDVLQMNLLNKCKLIASFRTDRFVTAKELWQKMNSTLSRGEKKELWGQVWSVPEANTPVYDELVHAIMKDPTKSSGSLLKKVAMVAMLLILIGGGGSIWWYVENGNTETASDSGSVLNNNNIGKNNIGKKQYDTVELFNKVSPSVVMFVAVADWQLPNGQSFKEAIGHGSGFIIDAKGRVPENSRLVMTNRHISDMFPDHYEYYKSEGVHLRSILLYAIVRDPVTRVTITSPLFNSMRNDVALVRIDNLNLPVLHLANSNSNIGEEVIVVGYRGASMDANQSENTIDEAEAAGRLALSNISALIDMFSPNEGFLPTLSPGSISGTMTHTANDGQIYDVLETSAMAGPGNSGGPMLNMYNQVVGVLTKGDGERKDEQGNVVHVGHSGVNLCIGIEEINKVLAEWQATR